MAMTMRTRVADIANNICIALMKNGATAADPLNKWARMRTRDRCSRCHVYGCSITMARHAKSHWHSVGKDVIRNCGRVLLRPGSGHESTSAEAGAAQTPREQGGPRAYADADAEVDVDVAADAVADAGAGADADNL